MNTSVMKRPLITWERVLLLALLCLLVLLSQAQVVNEDDLRKIELPARKGVIASLDVLPDGTIAAGVSKGGGVILIDTTSWTVARVLPVNGFPGGPRVCASRKGDLLQLKELWRPAMEGAKDMKGQQQVMDITTGKMVVDGGNAMDGALSANGQVFATLDGGSIVLRLVPSGELIRSIPVEGATNAIAIDPNGATVVVSHKPTEVMLQTVTSVRSDKKALKAALKYRQMVSFYSIADGRLLGTVPEIYDIVRSMSWTDDGTRVLVYSSADTRMQAALVDSDGLNMNMVDRPGRVEQIDATSMLPRRGGFSSLMNEPFLAVSPDGSLMALSSTDGHNKRKLTLYDMESGDTRVLIDMEQKHRYDTGESEQHDGRLAYTWMPDGRLLIALGDNLGIYTP